MNNTASELYNEQLGKLDNEYKKLSLVEKKKFHTKYYFKKLFLSDHAYNDFSTPPLEDDEEFIDIPMPPLESDEEKVKEVKGWKISKQTINRTSSIISTRKSWKQCIQTKK